MSGDVLAAALSYAEAGWPVFPLHSPRPEGMTRPCSCRCSVGPSPGKHPRTVHGFKKASFDAAVIKTWWRRWPNANVAICTGSASGLLVVDADGLEGAKTLRPLQRMYGSLGSPLWVRTGGGGWHCYFEIRCDRHLLGSSGELGPRIDIRAEGGYVVAPPSKHRSGRRSLWHSAWWTPAPVPAWLVELIDPPPPPRRNPPAFLSIGHRKHRYIEAALAGEIQIVSQAPRGGRIAKLFASAFKSGPS